MENVILIYPKTGIDPEKPQPPHSLLPLAAVLESHGYSPKIIDARVNPDYIGEVTRFIDQSILIGISSMTGFQIHFALKISRVIKEKFPSKPIVWGGVHPTFMPEQTAQNKYVDIVVRGEGEMILPRLVQNIERGKKLKDVKGITYSENDVLKSNPDETRATDLNEMPETPWHLLDIMKYFRDEKGEREISLNTSRGCPHRCSFCYSLYFHKKRWRGRNSKNVLGEVEKLIDDYGVTKIHFAEDNFFVDKKRVKEICEGFIRSNYDISWSTLCRVDYLSKYDESFISLLSDSGCRELNFGAESGSQKILNVIHKDITVDQIRDAVRKCKMYEITPQLSFMTGIPTETQEDLMCTLDLIDELKRINYSTDVVGLYIFTPYPGTPIYDLAIQHGMGVPDSLEEWQDYHFLTIPHKLPWLNRHDRSRLTYLTYFVRLSHLEDEFKTLFRNPFLKIGYDLTRKIGEIRWRKRYFDYPIESFILDRLFRHYSRKDY